MSVPTTGRTRVPAAIHMMFDGPTTTSGHDPPDVASHAAPVLPLRSGSPVRPLPPGRRGMRSRAVCAEAADEPAAARRTCRARHRRGRRRRGIPAGAHYAAATPGAHGFGLAMALVPPLLLALGAALRSPHRAWLVPAWLLAATVQAARVPLARHFEWGLYLEHASFNLAMALLFGRTLAAGCRFARALQR